MTFYAVHLPLKNRGVYPSWASIYNLVHKERDIVYKSFKSKEKAEIFAAVGEKSFASFYFERTRGEGQYFAYRVYPGQYGEYGLLDSSLYHQDPSCLMRHVIEREQLDEVHVFCQDFVDAGFWDGNRHKGIPVILEEAKSKEMLDLRQKLDKIWGNSQKRGKTFKLK